MQVKQRRTSYRGAEALDRHREYGWNCPATDIDCVEYDNGEPVGIIEYKHHRAKRVDLVRHHPTTQVKLKLANAASLPFFIVRYWTDPWTYIIRPVNRVAHKKIQKTRLVTEETYVRFLYRLRGRTFPDDLDLDTEKDPRAVRYFQKHT